MFFTSYFTGKSTFCNRGVTTYYLIKPQEIFYHQEERFSFNIIDSSLKYHIQTAKANGVTKAEMVEAITQLGFYAGWPKAWGAFRMAKEVYEAE